MIWKLLFGGSGWKPMGSRRFCLINNYWFEHPPLPRSLGGLLLIDGKRFDLSANRYPGVIHPQGFNYLKQFRLDPFPVFTYEIEGIEIKKSVFMIHGENSTVIHYELRRIIRSHRGTWGWKSVR